VLKMKLDEAVKYVRERIVEERAGSRAEKAP
jgi:hypothetical protein